MGSSAQVYKLAVLIISNLLALRDFRQALNFVGLVVFGEKLSGFFACDL